MNGRNALFRNDQRKTMLAKNSFIGRGTKLISQFFMNIAKTDKVYES